MFVVESNSADAEKPFGIEEITDDEKIYRRIPVSRRWVDATTRCIDPQAFAPDRKRDITGLSVVRAAHATPEQAAKGASRQGYYVAELDVGAVRAAEISVVHRPQTSEGYDRAHAELPDLNAANYKDELTDERQNKLAQLVNADSSARVLGPFHTSATL